MKRKKLPDGWSVSRGVPISHGEYWFHDEGNPKARFSLDADLVGERGRFLKPNTKVTATVFDD